MVEGLTIPEIKTGPSRKPPVGFHFAVIFYKDGVEPNSIDMYFKKVSGLSSEIETVSYKEGGENLFTHRLPNRVSYNNLVLERGLVLGTPVSEDFQTAMSEMRFYPHNVLVALLNEDGNPEAAWLFWKAYPVRWSVSDLDADANTVAIETMELAYTRFQVMRI
ncbi:MAG TPA: phage tail protein [Hydrogenispora sp.]|jgi:phage tail-like protein|nr:phage tail protein [Hydrogenispora sp.]